jgi:hypothetical protein
MLVDLLSNRRITMRMRPLALAIILVLLPGVFAQNANKAPCDRACLENYVDRYMDAMLANDPSLDLFARDCRFTENGAKLPLGGEGLWFGMSGKGTYKFYIPDIETQEIAFIGTAREGSPAPGSKSGDGTPIAIALRLKILNGLITEAEQIVVRPETNLMGGGSGSKFPPAAVAIEKVGSPHKVYSEIIPIAERPSTLEVAGEVLHATAVGDLWVTPELNLCGAHRRSHTLGIHSFPVKLTLREEVGGRLFVFLFVAHINVPLEVAAVLENNAWRSDVPPHLARFPKD